MCQCIWYLFFGPLHLKIPAPKNQQWRISFGDSDVFSFGISGLIRPSPGADNGYSFLLTYPLIPWFVQYLSYLG